jgi:hypothetical protein
VAAKHLPFGFTSYEKREVDELDSELRQLANL